MSQRTVLVAWELGSGIGHVARLAPLAGALADRGHRVVFALSSTEYGGMALRAAGDAVVMQAPVFVREPARQPAKASPAYTYADILHRCGYQCPETLQPLVTRWHQLFAEVKPALVLCDHSPTAVLAASGRVPVLHIGSGFATPPGGKPLQVLYAGAVAGAAEREAEVLGSIQTLQSQLSCPQISAVTDLFLEAGNVPCCLPELDPYRSTREVPACGPTRALPTSHSIPHAGWLFGYLTAEDPDTPKLLGSLARAHLSAGIFVRQATTECRAMVAGSRVTLFDSPQDMHRALADACAVIHHGGLATTEMALAVGRPQFLWPRNLEQFLTCNAVEALGCGINLRRQRMDPGRLIHDALHHHTYMDDAVSVASRLSQRVAKDVGGEIIAACLAHLG